MSSYLDQIKAAKAANRAVTTLETGARAQIAEAFGDWDQGKLDAQTVRYRLEAIVRSSYRTSAAVGSRHVSSQSEIPGWEPSDTVFRTDYLEALLSDVRRNLREYKKSDRDDRARRRAIQRMQHSAGVGAHRGYTDSLLRGYKQLQDFGYKLSKVWSANFLGNDPCEHCRALHGTIVGLNDEFPFLSDTPVKVYLNLQGPPRHPRCRCFLIILTTTLENAFDPIDIDNPSEPPEMIESDDVRHMHFSLFGALMATLSKILLFLRGGLG